MIVRIIKKVLFIIYLILKYRFEIFLKNTKHQIMISIKNHKKSEIEFSLVLKIDFFSCYPELTEGHLLIPGTVSHWKKKMGKFGNNG